MRSWLTEPAFLGRTVVPPRQFGTTGTLQVFTNTSGAGYVLRATGSDPRTYSGLVVISEPSLGVLYPAWQPAFSDTVLLPSNSVSSGDGVTQADQYNAYQPTGSETVTLTNNVASDAATYTLT